MLLHSRILNYESKKIKIFFMETKESTSLTSKINEEKGISKDNL